jgi:hypothetical protein
MHEVVGSIFNATKNRKGRKKGRKERRKEGRKNSKEAESSGRFLGQWGYTLKDLRHFS